jgi:tetratricopeptide (TPR) repeat protein
VQELATAAKAGDVVAYEKIVSKSKTPGPTNPSATAALHEVEIYYDLDAAQIFYPTWGDSVSKEDPGWSMDELLLHLRVSERPPADRIAIINTIGQLGRSLASGKGAVSEIDRHLEAETDLRVKARLIWAINILAKQNFRPLDFDAFKAWWKLHKDEAAYAPIYTNFLQSFESASDAKIFRNPVDSYDQTIQKDPNAIYARSLKTMALIEAGRLDDAEKELWEAEKIKPDYRWTLYAKARLKLAQEKPKEAIDALNAAMVKSPALENNVRSDTAFGSVITSPEVIFPSRSKSE